MDVWTELCEHVMLISWCLCTNCSIYRCPLLPAPLVLQGPVIPTCPHTPLNSHQLFCSLFVVSFSRSRAIPYSQDLKIDIPLVNEYEILGSQSFLENLIEGSYCSQWREHIPACVLNHFSLVQFCVTPMDCSPQGSSVHGILQARILEWVAMPPSRGSSPPRDRTQVCLAGGFFITEPPRKPREHLYWSKNSSFFELFSSRTASVGIYSRSLKRAICPILCRPET